MRFHSAPRRAGLALVFLLGLGGVPESMGNEEPERFVQVTTKGARIRNLADDKGVAIASPAVGDLLAVYGEIAEGWLLVEVPGGYSVWVYGSFLAETEAPEIFEVTRNAVQIRPGPSRDVTNFPLPQRLHAGDRVRVIERLDEDQPLSNTWAHIWSPAGVRAWIRTSATGPLADGAVGSALWNEALADLPATRPVPALARPAAESAIQPAAVAKTERNRVELQRELEAARDVLRAESKKDAPDVAATRRLFVALLEKSPGPAIETEAKDALLQLDVLEEVATLKAEMLRERSRRKSEILERQRDVWEASRKKDPLGEVFLARGVLFRRQHNEQAPRYYLRFGGKTVAELACSSGRYDLARFAGYELGVQGDEEAELVPDPSTLGRPEGGSGAGEIPRIDLRRIEIIQRR